MPTLTNPKDSKSYRRNMLNELDNALIQRARVFYPDYFVKVIELETAPLTLKGVKTRSLILRKDGIEVACLNVLDMYWMDNEELQAELKKKVQAAEDFAAAQQIEAFGKAFVARMKRLGFTKYRIQPHSVYYNNPTLFIQGSRSGDNYVECGYLGSILQQDDEALKQLVIGKIEQARVAHGL